MLRAKEMASGRIEVGEKICNASLFVIAQGV